MRVKIDNKISLMNSLKIFVRKQIAHSGRWEELLDILTLEVETRTEWVFPICKLITVH